MPAAPEPDEDARRPGSVFRLLTLVLGGAEVIAFLLFAHLMLQSSDPLGASIGQAMTLLMAAPLVLLTLPGVILACLDRAPRIAFGLVVLALVTAAIAWRMA